MYEKLKKDKGRIISKLFCEAVIKASGGEMTLEELEARVSLLTREINERLEERESLQELINVKKELIEQDKLSNLANELNNELIPTIKEENPEEIQSKINDIYETLTNKYRYQEEQAKELASKYYNFDKSLKNSGGQRISLPLWLHSNDMPVPEEILIRLGVKEGIKDEPN